FPPRLMQVDGHIRETLARFPAPGFFLVEAPDLERALQREDALFRKLGRAYPQADPLGLSRFVPSTVDQRASLDAWRRLMADPAALRQAFVDTVLPAELAAHLLVVSLVDPRRPLMQGPQVSGGAAHG